MWGLLVLVALLPIGLLSWYSYQVGSRAVRRLVLTNNWQAASIAGDLLKRDFETEVTVARAFAAMPGLVESVRLRDEEATRARLRLARQSFSRVERIFVTDNDGWEWSDYPEAPDSVGRNFADRDWYRAMTNGWQPVVSEVYKRHAQPRLLVVAVAAPIRETNGAVLGVIVFQYRLGEVSDWLRSVRIGDSGEVFIIDHTGTLAAHPDTNLDLEAREFDEYADIPAVRQALANLELTTNYFDPLADRAMVASFRSVPVHGRSWVVVAQQPLDEAMAPVRRLGGNIALAGGAIALAALAAVLVLGRISDRNRRLAGDLRHSNRQLGKLAAIVESSRDAIATIGLDGHVTSWNPGAEATLGYSEAEMLGRPILGLAPSEQAAEVGRILERLLRGEAVDHLEIAGLAKDGRRLDLFVTASPLRDEAGALIGSTLIARNITAHRQAERFQEAAHAVTDAFVGSRDLNAALNDAVCGITRSMEWQAGTFWQAMDDTGRMHCAGFWQADELADQTFEPANRQRVFSRGTGLPGRVWDANDPVCVTDLARDSDPRVPAALRLGLRAACAFPVRGLNRLLGVLEFFHREMPPQNAETRAMLGRLSQQLGQVLEGRFIEEALERQRRLVATMLENVPDHLYFKDRQSRFIRISQAMARRFGLRSPEEAVGRTDFDFFLPEHAQKAFDDEQRILQTGVPLVGSEEKETWPDGSVTWVSSTKLALRDERGEIVGIFGISRDITASKVVEEALSNSEALYHSLVDTLPINIVRKDLAGRVTFCNRHACATMGRSPEDLLGKTDYDIFPRELAEKYVADDRRVCESRQVFEDIESHVAPDGRKVWMQVIKAPVFDARDDTIGMQVMFWDVTARKEAEVALARTAADLARSNRDLEQFAYVASHDLQEPLRMIASYTQLLARRYKGQLDQDADEFIQFAVDGAMRMQGLINDLLAYSRVGTRGKPMVPTECEVVLLAARQNLKIAIEECGAVVTYDALPRVLADPIQLTQLLQNLLGNALKFRCGIPPTVQVSARLAEAAGAEAPAREWVFSVRDNGLGIERQYFGRIFEIFQRLHTREEYDGSGIGLAVCQRIIERHGGRIWVESEPGKGSTFFFTLPYTDFAAP